MEYEDFKQKLDSAVKADEDLNYELLTSVIKNPNRYTGIFRLSNARTKLIQNVTQSREIKFGDFMEDIVTEFIALMGYENLNKNIGTTKDGDELDADQVFKKDGVLYLIEQKIRDDHDSTKKRGQYDNFKKKYSLLMDKYPDYEINATMWFIDDSLRKNGKYYSLEAKKDKAEGLKINILYGGDLFEEVFKRMDIWEEICRYLLRNKQERGEEILTIPDLDASEEMLAALRRLKKEEPALFKKLISDNPRYVQLRAELFPTGKNINIVNGE